MATKSIPSWWKVESPYGSGQFIKDLREHLSGDERVVTSEIRDRDAIVGDLLISDEVSQGAVRCEQELHGCEPPGAAQRDPRFVLARAIEDTDVTDPLHQRTLRALFELIEDLVADLAYLFIRFRQRKDVQCGWSTTFVHASFAAWRLPA